jgi:hypothetical protein
MIRYGGKHEVSGGSPRCTAWIKDLRIHDVDQSGRPPSHVRALGEMELNAALTANLTVGVTIDS